MAAMKPVDARERASAAAVLAGLGVAAAFEVTALPETQDKAVLAASPWRADPYHTAVSLAVFAVAVLASATALRLLARRAPDGRDRARQLVRAAGTSTAAVAVALAFEWAAVVGGPPASQWGTSVAVQVGGVAAVSVLTAAATPLLVRARRQRGWSGRWRDDWLGDAVFLCRRISVLRRWVGPRAAAWTRRRALTVFLALSLLAAAAVTGAQAVGERVTDPLLIAWMLTAETAANLAFCVISNAVAGFVARPPRTRARRVAETSVVAGCLATVLAIAFHDQLWSVLGSGPLTAAALAALTLGAGLAGSLVTAALLSAAGPRSERDGAASA